MNSKISHIPFPTDPNEIRDLKLRKGHTEYRQYYYYMFMNTLFNQILLPERLDEFPYIVHTSDFIRGYIINCLIESGTPMGKCYRILHQVHFLDEEKALDFGNDDTHRHHDTNLPFREHDSLSLMPLFYLREVYEDIFESLEHPSDEGVTIDYLTILDMLLRLCHIPHDGAGRTNEDFLVLFCRKNKISISFSEDGYRGDNNTNSLVHKRYHDLKLLLAEIKKISIPEEYYGAIRGELITKIRQFYPKDSKEIREKKTGDNDFINYQLQKLRVAQILFGVLQNPTGLANVKLLLPISFNATQATIVSGMQQQYQYLTSL